MLPTVHLAPSLQVGPLSHPSGVLQGWRSSFGNWRNWGAETSHKEKESCFDWWRGVLILFQTFPQGRNCASVVKRHISLHHTYQKSRQTGFLTNKTLTREIAGINKTPPVSTYIHIHTYRTDLQIWQIIRACSSSCIWEFSCGFPITQVILGVTEELGEKMTVVDTWVLSSSDRGLMEKRKLRLCHGWEGDSLLDRLD